AAAPLRLPGGGGRVHRVAAHSPEPAAAGGAPPRGTHPGPGTGVRRAGVDMVGAAQAGGPGAGHPGPARPTVTPARCRPTVRRGTGAVGAVVRASGGPPRSVPRGRPPDDRRRRGRGVTDAGCRAPAPARGSGRAVATPP